MICFAFMYAQSKDISIPKTKIIMVIKNGAIIKASSGKNNHQYPQENLD